MDVQGAHDIFALVIDFLGFDWQPKQMTIKLLKQHKLLVKPRPTI
jgi:hypothetical protein